jgi:GTPase SAR1 family protein
VLIGNKSDLTDRKVVHVDEGAKFAGKYNMPYIEVSTKTTEGIDDCFYILAFRVFTTYLLLDILMKLAKDDTFRRGPPFGDSNRKPRFGGAATTSEYF